MRFSYLILFPILVLLAGCATPFPQADQETVFSDGLTADAILQASLAVHGGDLRESFSEVRLSQTGEWGTAIRRIQPIVTDAEYRISARETHFLQENRSRFEWTGPAGTKDIDWAYPDISVTYNGDPTRDLDLIRSSAMTSEAFRLFHLGPTFLAWRGGDPVRLADEEIAGRTYHRLMFTLQPGFGFSESDQLVAYFDTESLRLYRVWITLEGFRTTQGATVDLTYLEYQEIDGHLMPLRLDERVRAPIAIHAHTWTISNLELVPKGASANSPVN